MWNGKGRKEIEWQGTLFADHFIGDGSGLTGISGTGGGSWGSITGTLSNQTDLQTALDGKASVASLALKADNAQYQDTSSALVSHISSQAIHFTSDALWANINAASSSIYTHIASSAIHFTSDALWANINSASSALYAHTANSAIHNSYTPAYIGIPYMPNSAQAFPSSSSMITIATTVTASCIIRGLRFNMGASSGNISVGLYNSGGILIASSGIVASPGVNQRTVFFLNEVSINPGIYHLAISCDNTTATLARFSTDNLIGGYQYGSSHPCPTSIIIPGTATARAYALVGLVSGALVS